MRNRGLLLLLSISLSFIFISLHERSYRKSDEICLTPYITFYSHGGSMVALFAKTPFNDWSGVQFKTIEMGRRYPSSPFFATRAFGPMTGVPEGRSVTVSWFVPMVASFIILFYSVWKVSTAETEPSK